MGYDIGISTGFYHIAKASELLGMAAKVAYGAVAGIQFVQIDMESTSEFYEPDLKYQVDRVVKELGMKVGLHAEIGGETMSLDSALFEVWNRTHERLCESLAQAAKFGFVYVNAHLSARPQLAYEESRFRTQGYFYPVVGYDGQPIGTLGGICDRSKDARKYIQECIMGGGAQRQTMEEMSESVSNKEKEIENEINKGLTEELINLHSSPEWQSAPPGYRSMLEDVVHNAWSRKLSERTRKEIHNNRDFIFDLWRKSRYAGYILENSEIGAYESLARFMKETGDPIWSIHGGSANYPTNPKDFVTWHAAVAGKYLYGHVMSKWHPANEKYLGGMSMKEFCDQNKVYLLFEVPESQQGMEGLYRLYDPRHAYAILKSIGSSYVKLCIDFEHMLAQKLNPDDPKTGISVWPNDLGKWVYLFHLGRPIVGTPGTTHAQIPLGSMAQEKLYTWLWQLKKKGFENGYMIYERGGGETPLQVIMQSVQVLRQIKTFLEKDVPPDELPETFYGIAEQNEAVYKRQLVSIRDNALNPISGLLMIPEEAHTFLSRAAVEKGKAEEWKKGKYR
jgi:hypothetical protein